MPTISNFNQFARNTLSDNKVDQNEAKALIEKAKSGEAGKGDAASEAELKAELKNFFQENQANFDPDAKAQMAEYLGVQVSNDNRPAPTGTVGDTSGTNSTVFDVQTGHTEAAEEAAPAPAPTANKALRPTSLAFKGEASFEGGWKIKSGDLEDAYNGIPAQQFGTTNVKVPTGDVNVRDMHYELGDGKVGMRFVPVSDMDPIKMPDGSEVDKAAPMDNFLREEMGLSADDPIFALIAYVHPEKHTGDLGDLSKNQLKTEMGQTHMGAYLGEGNTSNSPETYHSRSWEVDGYPANVQMVSLDGVDQGLLNKNALLADKVLNTGVKFPSDYKQDTFRTIDLNTNLMFYRDWINDEDYLKNDPTWHCYCAEHKTIVTNIMLNVPHNEDSFKEIFGNDEGAKLWDTFKEKFADQNGRPFTAADETKFEPLWKKEGLTADQIRPFKDHAEWQSHNDARTSGNLDSYNGFKALEPGLGMAWPPETTSDLMSDFVETYGSFVDHNAVISASVLMGFKGTANDRMGMSDEEYFSHTIPVINKMMIAEAMVGAPENPEEWMKQTTGALYVALGGEKEDFGPDGSINPDIMGLVNNCMQGAKAKLPELAQASPISREEAYAWLKPALQGDIEKARTLGVAEGKVEFYSPPAVSHRVSIGLHESSKFVNIKTLCTAVNHHELEPDN